VDAVRAVRRPVLDRPEEGDVVAGVVRRDVDVPDAGKAVREVRELVVVGREQRLRTDS